MKNIFNYLMDKLCGNDAKICERVIAEREAQREMERRRIMASNQYYKQRGENLYEKWSDKNGVEIWVRKEGKLNSVRFF